jgi:hypothetical protein
MALTRGFFDVGPLNALIVTRATLCLDYVITQQVASGVIAEDGFVILDTPRCQSPFARTSLMCSITHTEA